MTRRVALPIRRQTGGTHGSDDSLAIAPLFSNALQGTRNDSSR